MDAQTFDRLIAAVAQRPSRRAALRLLAGGVLGTYLPARATRAQRLDSDQDGLFDDDEVNVYGTRPDQFDTDGDNVGDGEEIYNRDQGLGGPSDPLTNGGGAAAGACPAGQADCGAGCIDITSDSFNCGGCSFLCDQLVGPICENGLCTGSGTPVCLGPGTRCSDDWQCCNLGSEIYYRCCFNGSMLDSICTEAPFACPEFARTPPDYEGCPYPQSLCGVNCVDTWTNASHCGGCYISCALGGVCREGYCVAG